MMIARTAFTVVRAVVLSYKLELYFAVVDGVTVLLVRNIIGFTWIKI